MLSLRVCTQILNVFEVIIQTPIEAQTSLQASYRHCFVAQTSPCNVQVVLWPQCGALAPMLLDLYVQ